MPPSRRSLNATAALTEAPPDSLPPNCSIARVVKGIGNNLYAVRFPAGLVDKALTADQITSQGQHQSQTQPNDIEADPNLGLVELASRFRNRIWLRNGGFVVVDREAFAGRGNKLSGEIVNVVRQERAWMQMFYWPGEFKKTQTTEESDDDSKVGKMPSSPEQSAEEDEV